MKSPRVKAEGDGRWVGLWRWLVSGVALVDRQPDGLKRPAQVFSIVPHPPRVTLGLDPRALYFKMSAMGGYVYILADMRRGRTYIGVTNDLVRRVYEHREGLVAGYTKSHDIKRLGHFEQFGDITLAIQRETSLKRWYRSWKEALIEENNPDWRDLWDEIVK